MVLKLLMQQIFNDEGVGDMKGKLEKIKVLFGDVDNTLLCLKMYNEEGKRIVGFEDANDWLKYNINHNAYTRVKHWSLSILQSKKRTSPWY